MQFAVINCARMYPQHGTVVQMQAECYEWSNHLALFSMFKAALLSSRPIQATAVKPTRQRNVS
jgi:hypothetical protein